MNNNLNINENETSFFTKARYPHVFEKGLSKVVVEEISEIKKEPEWMKRFRLRSLEIFNSKPMPKWGTEIDMDLNEIRYYKKYGEKTPLFKAGINRRVFGNN